MTRPRRPVLALVAAAAAAAVTVPIIASSAPGDPLLPDLVSDAPTGPRFDTYDPVQGAPRLLVRFDGYVHNAGDGPLDIQGNPQLRPGQPGAMDQYLWNGTGARDGTGAAWARVTDHPTDPVVYFDTSDTHNHFHVLRAAEYSLWNEAMTAIVAPSNKVGFCQYDSEHVDGKGPAAQVYGDLLTGDFCRQAQPDATQLREGISEGWRDIYDWTLDYQWIDVSDVAPGVYRLASRMDPDDVFAEADERNNGYAYSAPLVVPGYRATAVTAATAYRRPVQVTLAADAFSTPSGYGQTLGQRRFVITAPPSSGTLRYGTTVLAAGSELPPGASTVQYVPGNAFSGADAFEFAARDAQATYPLLPVRATATVTVGGSGGTVVGLSGAPGRMFTGTQAQLWARASNGGAIRWSATAGTVSRGGVFTAPATVPAGGTVRVRASLRADVGAYREVVIPVVASPYPTPMPVVPGTFARGPLSEPGVLVIGRHVTVSAATRRAGTVGITLTRGAAAIASCRSRARAGQSVTCRFRIPRAFDPATLTARASLVAGGRVHRTSSVAGPSSFRSVGAAHRDDRLALAVVPRRPGLVTVRVTSRGRVVARCAARVRPGGSLACRRTVGADPVVITISLKDDQGRLAIRELRR